MKTRVLLVEDNAINMRLLRAVLEMHGYEVCEAADAEEALRMVGQFNPKLVLTDIQLPGMDGLELTRRLRAQPETSQLAIVAVTASAMRGDAERAIAAGCDGHIAKPIDTRIFPTIIAGYLEGRP
ncbi:MAG TPA: response regulator [Myxococcales bacterium]|nr:response regulator [Myxococcales bacterium]